MSVAPSESPEKRGSHPAITAAAAAFAAGTIAFAAWQVSLRLPQYFQIEYGEGFVWGQVSNLVAGRLYRPLSEFPIALMHYTPLFHAATALLWRLGIDPLLAGRLVSLAAGIGLAGACGMLAYLGLPASEPPRRRHLAALTAAALAIGTPEVVEWSTVMRVDMLSTTLGMWGLVALARIDRDRWALPLAGACFLLALSAKQSAVAPLVAGVGGLLWMRPRAGLMLSVGVAVVGLALIVGAEQLTHGEFLRHTILYDAARFRWDKFLVLALLFLPKSLIVLAIAAAIAGTCVRQSSGMRGRGADTHLLVSLALSLNFGLGLIGTLGLAKIGAGPAYLLPLLAPAAALAGIALVHWFRYAPILLVLLAGQTAFGLASYPFQTGAALAAQAGADRQVLQMMDGVDGPILSEDMSLLMRAGRPIPWELGSITELTLLGRFDETPLVQRFRDRWFKLVVIESGASQFYSPAIRAAIDQNYQRLSDVRPFQIWTPQPPSAESPDRAAKP